tara:strand:- start:4674 stop:5144 length:471 start_codon:yes stop_codon:yes gene_type:complete
MYNFKKLIKKRVSKLIIILVVLSFIFNYTSSFYLTVGDSMDPSKKNLRMGLVDKFFYDETPPYYGDVIVFYDYIDNEFLIKRVIGLPGDKIEIIDGWIFKNGEIHVDEFSHINVTDGISMHPWILGEKEYWVIGDNRDETWCGVIHESEIVGKIIF